MDKNLLAFLERYSDDTLKKYSLSCAEHDISSLANKISAAKSLKINTLNLKKCAMFLL